MSRARAVRKSRESEERDGDGDARDGRDCSRGRRRSEARRWMGGWCCCVVVVIVCLVYEDDAAMLGRGWYACVGGVLPAGQCVVCMDGRDAEGALRWWWSVRA